MKTVHIAVVVDYDGLVFAAPLPIPHTADDMTEAFDEYGMLEMVEEGCAVTIVEASVCEPVPTEYPIVPGRIIEP